MDWAAIRAAVRAAVVASTGFTEGDVQWIGNAAAVMWRGPRLINLILKSPIAVGVDETRYAYDGGSDELVPAQVGQRRFTVTVRIESEDQTDGFESVGTYASLLRTRFRRPSVLVLLRAVGVALIEIQTTQETDYSADDRRVSASITDLILAAVEEDVDTVDVGDYFHIVEIRSETLDETDGTPFPVQPSFTVDGS